MTTQVDVLNAQIADAQAKVTAEGAASALRVAKLNKAITDWQTEITNLENA